MRRVAVPLALTPDAARPREGRPVRLGGPTMAVGWRLAAHAPAGVSDAALAAAVQGACDAVVDEMSTWEAESDLSRFNLAGAGEWVAIPAHMAAVTAAALAVAQATDGAFDPTVGPLVDLWGFGPPGATAAPEDKALANAACGWRDLAFDPEGRRLRQPGGVALDFSGIAKGYAVDLAMAALAALGVRDALVEIGGEFRGSGVKGDGEPWWVELERPPDAMLDEPPLLVALHGLSLATSGDWRRRFAADGRDYSHTIDPATRRPVEGTLAAVSVLAASCMEADALCTALMVMGPRAEAFAREAGLATHLTYREDGPYREAVSPALEAMLA